MTGFLILLADHIRQTRPTKWINNMAEGKQKRKRGDKKSIQASEALTFRA